ncbi:MAG: Type IV pilus assembly protein PilQ [Ignavibacteria bacterium]|nr:MAG: Type IV pilus assembly protein PilQ [Ignavibacteria bacterium]KAF0160602.1 MAG: Type IV pilus assembly protein PilQ [Ignavibacteria bacterium]
MKKILIMLVLLGLTFPAFAQIDFKDKLKGSVNPEEIVSLSESLPFNQAVEVLSKVSEKLTGKKIVSLAPITTPIGVEIDKMQYKKALFIIVQYLNLVVDETEMNIVVRKKDASKEALTKDVYVPVTEREVKISALIFEANTKDMTERGVNWEYFLSRSGLSIGGKIVTSQTASVNQNSNAGTQNPPEFSITPKIDFTMGKFDGTATGLFRFFETENLGKILSRPTISTVNGVQGRTQVGSEFSIKERDFAGNLIDKFYQSGTIIEVTPHIINEDGVDYVLCKVKIEKSTVIPGAITTEKPKTEVTTSLLLLNGEEAAIGGLLVNDVTIERRGVPILKDLPWWVLGLRYLFGYDAQTESTKEIITLLKVEILPSLKDRLNVKKTDLLRKEIINQQNEMKNFKDQVKNASSELKEKEKLEEENN